MKKINIVKVDFREEFDRNAFVAGAYKGIDIDDYVSKYTQIAYDFDTGEIIIAVDKETGDLYIAPTDKISAQTIFETTLNKSEQQDSNTITIVVVDLTDEVERRQLYASMHPDFLDVISKENYTQIGYEKNSGKIVFDVIGGKLQCYPHAFMLADKNKQGPKVTLENGKLSCVDSGCIKFKKIGQVTK